MGPSFPVRCSGGPSYGSITSHSRRSEASRAWSGSGSDYLASYPLLDNVPELHTEVEVPQYAGGCTLSPRAFIGPRGAFTPLHYDLGHALSAQIIGSKRIIVVEFRLRDFVAHRDLRRPALLCGVIDPEAPDICGVTPKPLRRWRCTALPGDLVYLPGCRHHFVRLLDHAVSLTFFWHPPAIRAVRRALATGGLRVV
jgi:hypothetical protein